MGAKNNVDIAVSKFISRLEKEAREAIKSKYCLLCGTEQSSFCNSHSIPRFILSSIAQDGKVLISASLFDEDGVVDDEKGIKAVWTFHNICRDCDSRYFQEYEDESELTENPTARFFAQIALKDSLMMFYKYSLDRATDDNPLYSQMFLSGMELKKEDDELNARGELWLMKRAKKILEKNLKSGYVCVFCKTLEYTVPIAFQAPLYIYKSIDQKTIINDLFDYSEKNILKPLHVCVFPLKGKTMIYVFHHKDDRNYVPFDRQFQRLSDDKKLQYINYLIFKYSEHCVFSPKIDTAFLADNNLRKLAGELADSPSFHTNLSEFGKPQKFIQAEEIPNFLKMKL